MSISPKLREDGSGGAASPWVSDLDAVTITKDDNGRAGGTKTLDIDANGRIALHTDTNNSGVAGYGASANFQHGIVRGVARFDGSINHIMTLSARKAASNGTGVGLILVLNSTSGDLLALRYGTTLSTNVGSVSKTLGNDTDYECVFVFNGTAYLLMEYAAGTFPPGSDELTPTWDIDTANDSPAGSLALSSNPTTQQGKVSVGHSRFQTADVHGYWDDVLAWAIGESVDVPTVDLAPGNTLLTVGLTGVANSYDKRATLWRFLKYKSGSAPAADASDGTLVTGAGTGLGGSAIRSDGRWLDVPADFNITGLSNGTTYYVRPYAVMADGTLVAGTAVSAAPSAGDTTAPAAPSDFAAFYADPFIADRIDFEWTNPSEAGDYKITRRDDGVNPTGPTNGDVVTDWTAYTSNSAGSDSDTGLTEGDRFNYAIWHRDAALNVSGGAFLEAVAVDNIHISTFSPADGAVGVPVDPYVQWDTAQWQGQSTNPYHFHFQIFTDNSDEASRLASIVLEKNSLPGADGSAGFEYEASPGVWTALLSTGLAPADVGAMVRFKTNLDPGTYYLRVRVEQGA